MKRMNKLLPLLLVATLLIGCQLSGTGTGSTISQNGITSIEDYLNLEDGNNSIEMSVEQESEAAVTDSEKNETVEFDYSQIPEYSTEICIDVNEGQPYFTEEELQSGTSYYISLSELDSLGRCGSNIMAFCSSDMPTEERESIGNIKPTGWNQAKYDPALTESDSPFYQNRCHILCFAASGLNSEVRNLITGTRAFNLAMLSYFEEPLLKYLEDNPNMHVLYRGTPIFVNDELMARGILMEAESVEDNGASLKMCKYIYNIQRNVTIDYATGESTGPEFTGTSSEGQTSSAVSTTVTSGSVTYIANSNSMKFHTPDCENATKISKRNKIEITGTREEAIAEGYEPAGCCQP